MQGGERTGRRQMRSSGKNLMKKSLSLKSEPR
jgi:hypothetical protein